MLLHPTAMEVQHILKPVTHTNSNKVAPIIFNQPIFIKKPPKTKNKKGYRPCCFSQKQQNHIALFHGKFTNNRLSKKFFSCQFANYYFYAL